MRYAFGSTRFDACCHYRGQRVRQQLRRALYGLLACTSFAVAEVPVVEWTAVSSGSQGSPDADVGAGFDLLAKRSLVLDAAGNSIVTGSVTDANSADYLTVKFDPDGVVLWMARYNGPSDGDDEAHAVAVDAVGDVIVTGSSPNQNVGEYATVKYSASTGAQLWVARSGLLNSPISARAVVVDAAGDVVVTGASFNRYYTVKYSGATGAQLWSASYVGGGFHQAFAVAVDSAGDVLVTGTSNQDFATVKYSGATGAQLWVERYNGPSGSDDAQALTIDSQDNVIVTGRSFSPSANFDYVTVKYLGSTGARRWLVRYNGPTSGLDVPFAVAVDNADNVLVTGFARGPNSNSDYATIKYAAETGEQLWVALYNGPGNGTDSANALAVNAAGDVLVTGYSAGPAGDYDYATVKYSGATGAQLWESRFDGPANGEDQAYALAIDDQGGVWVAGTSLSANRDFRVVKYAGVNGAEIWSSAEGELPALADDLACGSEPLTLRVGASAAMDADGNTFAVGCAVNGSNGQDYLTVKFGADGTVLWTARYNGLGGGNDRARALALDAFGDVYVTGASPGTAGDDDYATVKYSGASGDQLWVSRYNGPGNGDDQAFAVALDGSGKVLVTGKSDGGASDLDYATLKYSGATGALLWESRYNGPGNAQDDAFAMSVDESGDVFVTGASEGIGSLRDYATVKYSGVDGAQIWVARYNGTGNSFDLAYALALDGSGDVLVTGRSNGNGTQSDYATVKYSGITGAQLWVARYNGPSGFSDQAHALAVDASGNVLVTGHSSGGTSGLNYATVKYNGASGAELWQAIYNGPVNSADEAFALVLDASGDVIVTGASSRKINSFDRDYATVKYSGATGAQIWEHVADFGIEGNDVAMQVLRAGDGSLRVVGSARTPQGRRFGIISLVERELSSTEISQIDPSPSMVGEPVTVQVAVSGVDSPPADGSITVTASTLESCTSTAAPMIVGLIATFSCEITFTTVGATTLIAAFAASSTHAPSDSSGAPSAHTVLGNRTVGGSLSGLTPGATVVLQNKGADDLALMANGEFSFATRLVDGDSYAVTVLSQPSNQDCSVTAGSGVIAGANVTSVEVECVINSFTVTPSAGPNGTIDPSTPQTVSPGQSAVFTLIADPAFYISSVGGSCGGLRSGSTYTTNPVVADCSVEAQFAPKLEVFVIPSADLPTVPINQPASFTIVVGAAGFGPADGEVLLTASSGDSCIDPGPPTRDGELSIFSCSIEFSTYGSRLIEAAFSGSETHMDGNGFGTNPLLVARFADLSVVIDDGQTEVNPGEPVAYLIELRNSGPDSAPGSLLQLSAVPPLVNPGWICSPIGAASCPAFSGAGALDVVVDLPANSGLDFVQDGSVPQSLEGSLEVQVLVQGDIEAPNYVVDPVLNNNVSSDVNLSGGVFADGFE